MQMTHNSAALTTEWLLQMGGSSYAKTAFVQERFNTREVISSLPQLLRCCVNFNLNVTCIISVLLLPRTPWISKFFIWGRQGCPSPSILPENIFITVLFLPLFRAELRWGICIIRLLRASVTGRCSSLEKHNSLQRDLRVKRLTEWGLSHFSPQGGARPPFLAS